MAFDVGLGATYLDLVAAEIRGFVSAHELPDGDTSGLFRIYAVLLLAMGGDVPCRDVHNAWVAWMLDRDATHDSLVPFDELPAEVAVADTPFVAAIRAAAESMGYRDA